MGSEMCIRDRCLVWMSVSRATKTGKGGGTSAEGICDSVGRAITIGGDVEATDEVIHPKQLRIIVLEWLAIVDELMSLYMIILADAFNTVHSSLIGETI